MTAQIPAEKVKGLKSMLEQAALTPVLFEGLPVLRSKLSADSTGSICPPVQAAEKRCASRSAAVFEAILLASTGEGDLSPDEQAQLAVLLADLTEGSINTAEATMLIAKFRGLLARDGLATRASYLARSLDDDGARRAAFTMAAGVALLNGESRLGEEQVFELLADALDLPVQDAEAILDRVRHERWAQR